MFNKKRKTPKYRFSYGQSPVRTNRRKAKLAAPKKNPRSERVKLYMLAILLLSFLILALYLLFFSSYLKIKQIVIENDSFEIENLSNKIIENAESSIGKSIVMLDNAELEIKIIENFPELEEVIIKKDYPSTITVSFKQYPLVANVINESNSVKKSYVINSIGYAIKEDFANPTLPYIRIKSDEPMNSDQAVIESSKLKYILDTISYYKDKFGMGVKEVQYKATAREVHILTDKDFYIWLDIQRPSEDQLKKLKKSLVKLDIYNEPFEYIDLRIAGSNGDKIICKRK